jgi:hypothetical protein
MSMETYEESGGEPEESIRCAHCNGINTHPAQAHWLGQLAAIEHKDTVWSKPCGFLGCEACPGVTGVHLMFHKGSTWLHTVALRPR